MRVKACSGPGLVSVTVGDQTIALNPGEELFVADHKASRAESMPRDNIGRRQLRAYDLPNNKTAVIGEFSLGSMLSNTSHLAKRRKEQARKLQSGMLPENNHLRSFRCTDYAR